MRIRPLSIFFSLLTANNKGTNQRRTPVIMQAVTRTEKSDESGNLRFHTRKKFPATASHPIIVIGFVRVIRIPEMTADKGDFFRTKFLEPEELFLREWNNEVIPM